MIQWFIQNFPQDIERMRNCSYHSNKSKNLHHLEGDVWSHTLLSYSKGIDFGVSKTILLALMLHDRGRIYTRYINEKKDTVHFGDFEGVSCFTALEVLNNLHLSNTEKVRILQIIMHQYTVIDFVKYDEMSWENFVDNFQYDEELLQDLFSYVKCDLFGRIIDSRKEGYYDLKKIQSYELKSTTLLPSTKDINTKQGDVYILIGLPCSGKSTWRSEFHSDAFVVSRDLCIDTIGKKYMKDTHDEAYSLQDENEEIDKEVNTLFNARLKESYLTQKHIIIDNLSLGLKDRAKWIKLYKTTHNIHAILFLKSFGDILDCDNKRSLRENKTIGKTLFLKHMMKFRFPLINEGFDSIEYIFT